MNINIQTKFNVGDMVYVADLYHDFYPQKEPYLITDLRLKANINHSYIRYEVQRDDVVQLVPEEWIFATYADCTKWCDKRNKSL